MRVTAGRVWWVSLWVAGCGQIGEVLGPPVERTDPLDAGTVDETPASDTTDAGSSMIDAGSIDAGTVDMGAIDAGTMPDSGSAVATGACGMNAEEQAVFNLLNEERDQAGVDPVVCDATAGQVARAHSQDMCDRQYFDHTDLEGGSPFDRLGAAGVRFRTAGENIAAGQRTPEAVNEGWMNSTGHRRNMLNGNFTHAGIGWVSCNNDTYPTFWTQVFFSP